MSLNIKRYFTKEGQTLEDILNSVDWIKTDVIITGKNGIVFKQKNVEFPDFWSENAIKIVASKYFYGKLGTEEREFSLKQLIGRVVNKIVNEGYNRSYFTTKPTPGMTTFIGPDTDFNIFRAELGYMLLHQMFQFNSPVLFNVGTPNKQAVSACYILGIDDNLESIFEHATTEGKIFSGGSGSGVNISTLRHDGADIRGGGKSSGPLSFNRIYETVAASTKSGGRARRAARMVIMDINHPDIIEFIKCKSREEEKARALIKAGFDDSIDGEAYSSVMYQNANHSVRISDTFMNAVKNDEDWDLIDVTKGDVVKTVRARYLWDLIAQEAHKTGDPGIQFDSHIQKWDTCPSAGRITATNPCAEYIFKNFTSCNLGSFNLMKFYDEKNLFNIKSFCHGVELATIAMNILIDFGEYPTEKIAHETRKYRTIGIGYANLGSLLMAHGLPYDSDEGRHLASAITSLMTAQAYKVSVKLADKFGPYDEWDDHHLKIVNKHWDHNFVAWKANQSNYIGINAIYAAANDIYDGYLLAEYEQSFNPVEPRKLNYNLRFRNAQVTVIAPTGSIGLAMDCDTTGCEPELSLVKHKFMVGGGHIEYINSIVKEALVNLGSYNDKEIELIINHIKESGTIENSNILNSKHLPIFDCSFKPQNGVRFLSPEAHVKMLAAIQPHISGGLSKTVNLPNEATVEDIQKIYQLAYDLKVKCIAVYRDGCKMNQPLTNTVENKDFSSPLDDDILFTDVVRMAKPTIRKPFTIEPEEIEEERLLEYKKEADRMGPIYGDRKKLPDTRHSITHKCNIGGQGFYITIGLYEDGNPAEIFITCSRHGSFARGTLDALGTFLSFALQYGAPVEDIVRKLKDITFSPNGITTNKEIPMAKSILDYLGKFLENTFLYTETTIETEKPKDLGFATGVPPEPVKQTKQNNSTFYGEPCSKCGDLMFRDGRCFTCRSCGFSSGGCS